MLEDALRQTGGPPSELPTNPDLWVTVGDLV